MNQSVGGKATIYANKNVRLAVSEAVNKQSYVDAFYSGLGKVPTGFMRRPRPASRPRPCPPIASARPRPTWRHPA